MCNVILHLQTESLSSEITILAQKNVNQNVYKVVYAAHHSPHTVRTRNL